MAVETNFRMLWVSSLAALIGIAGRRDRLPPLQAYRSFTTLPFFTKRRLSSAGPRMASLGPWVIAIPRDRRTDRGSDGEVRVIEDPRPRHSRSDGSRAGQQEQDRTARSDIEANLRRHRYRRRRTVWRGRPDYSNGRPLSVRLLGQVFHATAAERKVLLACGAAAGMAATFSTPVAAVVLAIELLLFEFRSRSFIPLVIASTLSTSMHLLLMGRGPMFQVGSVEFGIPYSLSWYVLLGLLCGLAAVGFSKLLYWVEDQFERLPLDPMWWPAIGGRWTRRDWPTSSPRVLGVGYYTISDILTTNSARNAADRHRLQVNRPLVVSLGSGTSGGLLAPIVHVPARPWGRPFAMVITTLFRARTFRRAAFALVAMERYLEAASRATFAFIIFAFELTRDYNSVLPLMLVCVIADGIGMTFMKTSIMTEKLARRGLHINQDYEADVLMERNVEDVMDRDIPQVSRHNEGKRTGRSHRERVIRSTSAIRAVCHHRQRRPPYWHCHPWGRLRALEESHDEI